MYCNIYQYHRLSSETHLKVQLYFSDVVRRKIMFFSPVLNMLVIKRETGGYMGTINTKNP